MNNSDFAFVSAEKKTDNKITLKIKLSETGILNHFVNQLINEENANPDIEKIDLLQKINGVENVKIIIKDKLYAIKYKEKLVKLAINENPFSSEESIVTGAGFSEKSSIFYAKAER